MRPTKIVSEKIGLRAAVSALAVSLFGAAAAWTVAAAISRVDMPAIVVAAIASSWFVVVAVMAFESVSSSIVMCDASGYRRPLGGLRPWETVVRVGTGMIEGQRAPTVALRSDDGDFPIGQDTFGAFASERDAGSLVSGLLAWAPQAAAGDFSGVDLGAALTAEIETSATSVQKQIESAAGMQPETRTWIEFGYPGLSSAILLDYGENDSGERIQVIARRKVDLAIVMDGRRWLRVVKKRSPDVATGFVALLEPHTTTRRDAVGLGFDQLIVTAKGLRPTLFNAEEPDRFL